MSPIRRSLLQSLAHELALMLDPVALAVESPEAMERLMAQLGVFDADAAPPAATFEALLDLKSQIEALAAQDDLDFEAAKTALQASRSAYALAGTISDVGGATGAIENFGRDLVDLLLETWLLTHHPVAREVAALLTLLEAEPDRPTRLSPVNGDIALRTPIRLDRLRLDRLPDLLRNPVAVLKAKYVNELATDAEAAAMADRLFPQLVQLLRSLGVSCNYGFQPGDEPLLGDAAALMKNALIIYAVDPLRNGEDEAGVVLTLSPASSGDLGLVVSPFGVLNFSKSFERWEFQSKLVGQIDVLAWGRHGLTLLAAAEGIEVEADLVAETVSRGAESAYVFGANDGTRIELGGVRMAADIAASQGRQSVALSLDVSSAAIVIAPGDGDGFIRGVLPAQGVKAEFDLGLAWSNERGLTLRGAGGLEATLTSGLSIGGVLTVPAIYLSLQARDAGLLAEVSANVGVAAGPVHLTIERVGVGTTVSFPDTGGNLGVADLDFGFKPPNGVGLSLDVGGFRGGGFLRFDPEKGEYAGALELDFNGLFSVKAIGVINTKMPDGAKGFSLLIVISSEFTPIQLSFGFTLNGVGGIFGLNRGINLNALAEGIRTNAVKSILFPENVIANISRILSDIKQFFPQQPDHFVVGPMAKLGWGTPSIITVELGLLLDLPDPMFAIVGVLKALLPEEEAPILRLQVNFLGVADFNRGYVFFRADLFDSRLLAYSITGSMAFLVSWGEAQTFALSVGGFHPDFRDLPTIPALPDGFRSLARIGLSLLSDDNPRLKVESYFAVTSNTVQFGARVELYAEAGGFNVYGFLGYDVLFQFDPFRFVAKLSGGIALRRRTSTIAGVNISATLSGPTPWDARGKATLSLLFFSISVGFHVTWGDPPPAVSAATEDLLALLLREFADTRNWRADLPPNNHLHVSLRNIELPAATDMLVVHPAGVLTFSQRSLPLEDFVIQKFGNKKPLAEDKFRITDANSGGAPIPADFQNVREQFASGNFLELSDSEKLSRKSFDKLPSGFKLTATSDLLTTLPVVRPVDYELSYLRNEEIVPRGPVPLFVLAYDRLVKGSAVRQSGLAQQQTRVSLNAPPQVGLPQETFAVANAADLRSQLTTSAGPVLFATQAEAYQQQQELIAQNPALAGQLQVVSHFELNVN